MTRFNGHSFGSCSDEDVSSAFKEALPSTYQKAFNFLAAEFGSESYRHPDLARMLSWPSERKNHNYRDGVHSDVYDGEWWSEGVLGDDNIAPNGDLGRSLVFGICGDGVDPMDHKNYSMWPLSITCWNLPGHIRMTLPALGLLCIIPPGPNGTEPSDSSLSWIYLLTSSG
ncbi:hypothetical protein WJX77_000739 [Trebouxia sp. C0004]